MNFIRSIIGFFRLIVITGLFFVLLIIGMAAGGYFLLDYIVTGETVVVPNLYGKTESQAIEALVKQGLLPRLPAEERASLDVEPGLIISQRPAPGTYIKKHRSVSLVISMGQQKIFVPDFTGREEAEIRGDLQSAGLEIGQKISIYSPTVPSGTILSQEPLPGHRLLHSRRIHLLVSLGPAPTEYIMPHLIGLRLDQIRAKGHQSDLNLSEENIEYERTADISKWFRVIEQNPLPGSRVQENEPIRLKVGSSGLEISNLRIIEVECPIPPDVFRDRLALMVWDDISSLFDKPAYIDVSPQLWEDEIQMFVPVIGEAFVVLSEKIDNSIYIYPSHYFEYFPLP